MNLEKLLGRDRSLPGEVNLVSEGYKVSERDHIIRNASLTNFIHADFMDGIYIDHATRACTEVQVNGKALSTGDCCVLTVNWQWLAERAACTLYRRDEQRIQQVVCAGRTALAAVSSADRALFDARLREIAAVAEPDDILQAIESLISDAIAQNSRATMITTREDAESIAQEASDEVSPDAVARIERLSRIVIDIPADARRAGRLEEASRLVGAAVQFLSDLGTVATERIAAHRATATDRRGDLLRANRHHQVETGGRFWRIVSNFFREEASASPNAPAKDRTAREYAQALGKLALHGALEASIRTLRASLRREAERVSHALDLADAKLRRGTDWHNATWENCAPIRGICLEDLPEVIEAVLSGFSGPETELEIGRLGDTVEQINAADFAAQLEMAVRSRTDCGIGINALFGKLNQKEQDSILNRLLAMPSVPVRRIAGAIWTTDYIFACPGGPASPIWRAAQRQPNAARFRAADFNELPDTAVALVWVKFIRPAELEAYHEGRAALEQIAGTPADAMPFYAIPALALEADPSLDSAAIEELIVKGIALGIISASRLPAVPPFYFVNGHAGGRPVHTLAPHIKRQLPKLGNTTAEMSRTIATNGSYRAEVATAWGNRLRRDGCNVLATLISNLLAQDALNTPDLRQAAGRLIHRLEKQHE